MTFSVMVGDDKNSMTLKHQIWCNFNIKFGIMVGDAVAVTETDLCGQMGCQMTHIKII